MPCACEVGFEYKLRSMLLQLMEASVASCTLQMIRESRLCLPDPEFSFSCAFETCAESLVDMSSGTTLLLPMVSQQGWGERSAVDATMREGPPALAYGGGFAAQYQRQQQGAVVPWPDVCALIDMAEEALHAKTLKIEVIA